MSCWVGSFSFDLCCSGAWGIGLTSCWDDAFNWDTCCVPEMQQILIDKGFDLHDVQDPERLRSLTASEGVQGRGAWQQDMAECIDTYDKTENYRFYRRHSGMLGHDIAHVGNPDVCTAGGHNFYWGYVVFRLPHGQPPRDLALEFSLCVPRACSFSVVETIFVPYTLGRYLGRNWGPQTPEIMTRWQVDAMAEEVAKEDTVRYFVYQVVALHARGPAGWYEQEWPYRQQVWQYQPSWWPSPTSCAVLAALAAPPLVAGICLQLVKRSGSSFCLSGLRTFAPQSHIYDLWVTRSDGELPQLHTLRVVLQLLVCWQHAVLLVDWLGNSGFAGIEGFLPITSQVAKVLARVNNTFACLSLVLSMRSMQRTLGAVRSAGGGIVQSVLAALVWMMRRWLRQACELGFWMFFYLVLAREIPWKPFPDFTFIWYKDAVTGNGSAAQRP
ncbi:unnamed protein product [Symbiodinium natans]|uniref:Uncharacterized protein n=1 Tax=Symbiodinium natans TaxID=878477 RepID=A0A812HUK2_9DINO|nr:unnamed protein product [Symbiodinium natans]